MLTKGIFENAEFNVWLKVANAKAYCNDVEGIERIFLSYIA